ncbi:MAG: hypothetical protein A3F18_08465 [Legionellales bacterium RIFCSPHIGHO2_12_FULL_37_14]|nr:MAG: hypothetical protein A3F18_08465 [Legionellales bacterium RIFCSPHIGHO2_12_FULL_37_14]
MTGIIPIVNLTNKQILTQDNYLSLGIKTLAFSLEALLIKPGFQILIRQKSLKAFVGWPFNIMLIAPNTQFLKIKSPFDGSYIENPQEEIDKLINKLDPNIYELNNASLSPNITAKPLLLAQEGKFYAQNQVFNLLDSKHKTLFSPLSTNCTCPTCKRKLTQAYLHHLLSAVPLLAERYLGLHNLTLHYDALNLQK